MKKLLAILILLSSYIGLQAREISKDAYFSILTCAPGTEIHAHFGHTALRFVDTVNNTDLVFNYGIFEYSDDFAYNFVKGETYYRLGVEKFSSFISDYYFDSRAVVEQKLSLSPQEVQMLFDILKENYRPENRRYLYNFFYDNCSSRPRDLLNRTLGDAIIWKVQDSVIVADTMWMKQTEQYLHTDFESRTWRDFIHSYVGPESWVRFGISLGLGMPTDSHITANELMFLPDGLFIMAENAVVERGGKFVPLVVQTQYLVKPEKQNNLGYSFFSTPSAILWIIALIFICITIIENKVKKHMYWLDSLLYFIVGLVGIFVWYVSFFSIHPAVFPNINVLWASPLHIIFALLWFIPILRNSLRVYITFNAIIFIFYIITIPLCIQFVHSGYVAIIIILGSRIEFKKIKIGKIYPVELLLQKIT
jgi:hypothetical protein